MPHTPTTPTRTMPAAPDRDRKMGTGQFIFNLLALLSFLGVITLWAMTRAALKDLATQTATAIDDINAKAPAPAISVKFNPFNGLGDWIGGLFGDLGTLLSNPLTWAVVVIIILMITVIRLNRKVNRTTTPRS